MATLGFGLTSNHPVLPLPPPIVVRASLSAPEAQQVHGPEEAWREDRCDGRAGLYIYIYMYVRILHVIFSDFA